MTMRRTMILASALMLAGCTSWFESDQPYLRTKTNLLPGQHVVVDKKTTAYAAARKYKVPMDDLIVLNRLRQPYVIWPGQEIILPLGGSGDLTSTVTSGMSSGWGGSGGSGSDVTASELPPPNYSSSAVSKGGLGAPTPITPSDEDRGMFIWPVEGPLLSSFGPKTGGTNNDGLNIAVPRGTPVQAAANGIVVYAGNEMKGYGNLVLIRHGDGYITAYAHLDRMVVDKDSVIAKGDMIGTVGSTGDVTGPQLHFEIRKDGKSIDPLPLMPVRESSN
ncbi:MAG: M23 family metallopeptidase [Alphaproteobacteria bacterium]